MVPCSPRCFSMAITSPPTLLRRLWKKLLASETATPVAILALITSTIIAIYFGVRQLPTQPGTLYVNLAFDHRVLEDVERFELPLKLKLEHEHDHPVVLDKTQHDLT